MKRHNLLLSFVLLSSFYLNAQNSEKEEWISLFNGVDLSGWEIKIADYDLGTNLHETFVVED